jgi:hypothetical protein
MPGKAKQTDFSELLSQKDLEVDLQVKTAEDEQQKVRRLRREDIGFYVKDLGAWIFAVVIVSAVAVVSFWIIMSAGFTPVEKDWARAALSAFAGGAVGMVFGTKLGK